MGYAAASSQLKFELTAVDATSGVVSAVWTAAPTSRSRDRASRSRGQQRRSSASPADASSPQRWLSMAGCDRSIGEVSASSARRSATTTPRRPRSVSGRRKRSYGPGAIGGASSSGDRYKKGAGNENLISSPRLAVAASIVGTPPALRLCSSIIEIHRRRSLASESSAEVSLG